MKINFPLHRNRKAKSDAFLFIIQPINIELGENFFIIGEKGEIYTTNKGRKKICQSVLKKNKNNWKARPHMMMR